MDLARLSRCWIALQALLILVGCAATEPKPAAPPVLSLESCPAAGAPLDVAALNATHQTLESLVTLGEVARERLLSAQCAYGNGMRRRAYLLAVGRQLTADLSDYLGQAEAWQQAYGRLDRRLRDYYQRCLGEPLEGSRYQECAAENTSLDAERQQLNDQAVPLQQRNQSLTAAVTKYRGDLQASEIDEQQVSQDYTRAMQDYGRWLAGAYALSISPAVQPYAAREGCPAVSEPPQSVGAMLPLGDGLLGCFRKITGLSGTVPAG